MASERMEWSTNDLEHRLSRRDRDYDRRRDITRTTHNYRDRSRSRGPRFGSPNDGRQEYSRGSVSRYGRGRSCKSRGFRGRGREPRSSRGQGREPRESLRRGALNASVSHRISKELFSSRKSKTNHWAYLEKLLTGNDGSDVVTSLITNSNDFEKFLGDVSCKNMDLNFRILDVIDRAFQSECTPQMLLILIDIVKRSTYLHKLISKIREALDDNGTGTDETHLQLISLLEKVIACLIQIFNKTPSDIVYIFATHQLVKDLKQDLDRAPNENTYEALKTHFEIIDAKVEHCRTKQKSQSKKEDISKDVNEEMSFRKIPVFPSAEDMRPVNTVPPINKIFGKYDDCEQYLDTHFKLLREDCIAPLRDGILSYHSSTKRNVNDVRLYENVRIRKGLPLDGMNHLVTFDISKLKRIRWGLGKRLKYGSLICFSSDGFKSCYFATVSGSNPKDLRKGQLHVKFNETSDTIDELMKQNMSMAESPAYFEAYRHVLKTLQSCPENTVPFARYIVECEKEVLPPEYLTQRKSVEYDLSVMLQEESKTSRYMITDGKMPKLEETCLNKSQLDAIRSALTTELSLIQGPPGCGKTFVGLMIARILLQNSHIWRNAFKGKLLVVCYTNHALDQFLEGILPFQPHGIVRVGGRSKNEKLEEFNIKNIRSQYKKKKQFPYEINELRRRNIGDMRDIKKDLTFIGKAIQILNENIVNYSKLHVVMDVNICKQFTNARYSIHMRRQYIDYNSIVVEWLGLDDIVRDLCLAKSEFIGDEDFEYNEGRESVYNLHDAYDYTDDNVEKNLKENIDNFKRNYLAIEFDTLSPGKRLKNIEKHQWRMLVLQLRQEVHIKMTRTCLPKPHGESIPHIFRKSFSHDRRWQLYCWWVSQLSDKLYGDSASLETEYEEQCELQREVRMQEEKVIMGNARVIGMTSTTAARIQPILKEIKPEIVIIEEAAEVLEAHVTCALTTDCKHAILIGDHKQLRPKPIVYKLEKEFNLGISMFERLVRNKIEYKSLNVQHRMRPEIANLIRFIYEDVEDSASVHEYDKIKGCKHSLFFVSHTHPESRDNDIAGYHNGLEADFLFALYKYFIVQGYKSSQITVLTAYKGQYSELRKKFQNEFDLKDVSIKVIDDYQGEENDIVLVSFVRSNDTGRAGFLKTDNRVCVALSRARQGLFAIGNFEMLAKSSRLWQKVVNHLKPQKQLEMALPLQCQNHPNDEPTMVSTADDFRNVPDGGCKRMCEYRLECGHSCKRKCHPDDREHKAFLCQEPCHKKCRNNHTCQHLCSKECYCEVLIKKQLECGHSIEIKCEKENDDIDCEQKCTKKLSCGHICTRKCNEKCEPCREDLEIECKDCGHKLKTLCFLKDKPCVETCKETLDCGHKCPLKCGFKPDILPKFGNERLRECRKGHKLLCQERCRTELVCGHRCDGECGICINYIHDQCQKLCDCNLICGHKCSGICGSCEPCGQKCNRKCRHSSCKHGCKNVCIKCHELCSWTCKHFNCTQLCGEPCDRERCYEPCKEMMPCGHFCSGMCGDPCPTTECLVCNPELEVTVFKDQERDAAPVVQLDDCGHLVAFDLMDDYMDSEATHILKKCIRCCKPIWRTNGNRYEGILNATFSKINQWKDRMCLYAEDGLYIDYYEMKRKVEYLNTTHINYFIKALPQVLGDTVRNYNQHHFTEQRVTDIVAYLNKCFDTMTEHGHDEELYDGNNSSLQPKPFQTEIFSYDIDNIPDICEIEKRLQESLEHELPKMDTIKSITQPCLLNQENDSFSEESWHETLPHLSIDQQMPIDDMSTDPFLVGDEVDESLNERDPVNSEHLVIHLSFVKIMSSTYFQQAETSEVFERFRQLASFKTGNKSCNDRSKPESPLVTPAKTQCPEKKIKLSRQGSGTCVTDASRQHATSPRPSTSCQSSLIFPPVHDHDSPEDEATCPKRRRLENEHRRSISLNNPKKDGASRAVTDDKNKSIISSQNDFSLIEEPRNDDKSNIRKGSASRRAPEDNQETHCSDHESPATTSETNHAAQLKPDDLRWKLSAGSSQQPKVNRSCCSDDQGTKGHDNCDVRSVRKRTTDDAFYNKRENRNLISYEDEYF